MFKLEHSLLKIFRYQKINCFRCAALQKFNIQLRNVHVSSALHLTRKFKGIENEYMFKLVSKSTLDFPVPEDIKDVETMEQFEALLNTDYRAINPNGATKIVNAFRALEKFCCLHKIDISDHRFDKLVDGLMDHCKNLTDNELLELLLILARLPRCSSFREHNFHDVWSCLDDMTRKRLQTKDLDLLFKLADIWYELDLGKVGDYVFDFLDVLTARAKYLTKDQVVKGFFYMNVCRRKEVPFDMHGVVEKYLNQFNIDELGIIALGFFKSQTTIKLSSIILAMISAVKKECSTINEITLSSILKVLRFSKPTTLISYIDSMLNDLIKEIDRLSLQSCLHIAIMGSSMIHYHEASMNKAIQKMVSNIENVEEVRLKDIERILIASTMVDYRPKVTPDLFEAAFKEIHEQRRINELATFPRLLPCILGCFSMVNMYSYELMNRILDVDYIFETYGKNYKSIANHIYALDSCIDIECPDYKGNRLPLDLKYKLVKWQIDFIPSYKQPKRLTVYDKLHLEVEDILKSIIKNKDALRVDHIVPHFGRADFVLCKDKNTNEFIEPPGFERFLLGDVKYAFTDPNLKWYSISVIGWNNTVRNTNRPVGMVIAKQRHLRKIGYNSQLVIWSEFINLSEQGKLKYIQKLLR